MMDDELTGEMMNESEQTDISPFRKAVSEMIIRFIVPQNFVYFVHYG